MPQYRFDIKQNSDEWLTLKVGKFSASTATELLMDKKTVGYTNLINRIVEERITGKATESKTFTGNVNTERGHEYEPLAREHYEFSSFNDVIQVGVVELDEWCLCSPDGLINDNGLIQIKCPNFNTQKEYLKNPKVPTNYYKQMQFELFVTGREYNVFYSFHNYLPAVEIKVQRDEQLIYEISERLNQAKTEVLAEIEFLKSLK
ncbi:MAG TPA: YqaJ viral recombinase family protein [Flavobacterium sp.]|nr:YqaJ viral recombinase family protein [Flavobacterium sp.]